MNLVWLVFSFLSRRFYYSLIVEIVAFFSLERTLALENKYLLFKKVEDETRDTCGKYYLVERLVFEDNSKYLSFAD